jgi:glucokinase-like ROK family protein
MKKSNGKNPRKATIIRGDQRKVGERPAAPLSRRPLADRVLQLAWQERRISRAEIAHRTGLSRSTVSEIVDDLLKTGLVAEVGTGRSRGGRRPIVLGFQDEARGILGVDIGATHVAVALTDLRGRVLMWKEKAHPVRSDPEGTRALVTDLCDACLATWSRKSRQLLSVGVAVPSPVDPLHPEWLSEAAIPAWHGRNELERLHNRYGVPVYVDNDANVGALAEHWWGAGRGIDDLIYMKLAYGIGAGYILGGELYRGAGGVAGEMGHMPIDRHGPPCVCGLNGCLATYVGAEALSARAAALLAEHPDSQLAHREPTVSAIEDAALAGDVLALQVVKEAAENLSIAVAGWLNLMKPTLVVLGGGLARLGDLLLEPIREKVRRYLLAGAAASARIRTSELGPKAVAIGAATLALDAAFADPNILRRGPRPGVL